MKKLMMVAAALFVSASVSMFAGNPQTASRTAQVRAATAPVRAAQAVAVTPDPAFLKRSCVGCHNDRAHAGDLSLEALDPAHVDGHVDIGEKVVRKLRTGMMPPENAPKPSAAARDAFASALEGQLDRVAALHPDPGAPALHRLNRAEYAQRDPRSARARRRRDLAAAAGRFGGRIRQHRRRARRLARAHRGLRVGRRQDQPPRRRRSVDRSRSRDVSRARRSRAGCAPRRAAARHARRHRHSPHVSARCRVRPGGRGGRRWPSRRRSADAAPTIHT